jgi:hypothetical protein
MGALEETLMKPVVSSLVALAIAIAAPVAMATPENSTPAKHVVHKATKKKADKTAIVHVKHVTKKADAKKAEGHKGEPKVDHGVTVIPASLTAKPKLTAAKLPSKAAHAKEKGAAAKKAAPKKEAADKDGGQPERDEDFAELVARIRGKSGKHGKCTKDVVEIARGSETESLELVTCDGAVAPLAVEKVSILVRPGGAARPTTPIEELAKKKGAELARGIKRVDPKLVMRMAQIVEHFAKAAAGGPVKMEIVSGYRPTSSGSLHASGKAVDFRLEGAKNEDIVAFCRTLNDTGCGFYPNSSFVHIDVRDPGAGHVSWIDASGPGEPPRYVSQWPEPAGGAASAPKPDGIENATAKHEEEPPPPLPPPSEPIEK